MIALGSKIVPRRKLHAQRLHEGASHHPNFGGAVAVAVEGAKAGDQIACVSVRLSHFSDSVGPRGGAHTIGG